MGKSASIFYQTHEDFDFVDQEKYRQIQLQVQVPLETKWRRKNGTIINIILSSAPIDTEDLSWLELLLPPWISPSASDLKNNQKNLETPTFPGPENGIHRDIGRRHRTRL